MLAGEKTVRGWMVVASLSVPRDNGNTETAYRCRHCGAPLRVGPDTVVALCPYCGTPNWIRGRPSELLVVKPLSVDMVREKFEEFRKKDPDLSKLNIVPARIEITLLPFYTARLRMKSEYRGSGMLTVQVVRKRGDRVVTETTSVPFHVEGVFSSKIVALVSAKRVIGEEAVDDLAEMFLREMPSPTTYEEVRGAWNRELFKPLGADYDAEEASRIVKDDACDWLRDKVEEVIKEKAKKQYRGPGVVINVHVGRKTIPCDIEEAEVKGPLFLPLAKVFYVYEGKIYRAYFAGWNMKPLIREEPFTAMQRLAMIGLGGAIGGGGVAGAIAAFLYLGGWEGLIASGLLFILGLAGGYFVSKAGLSEARVEKGEAGGWLKSVTSTVEEA